MTSCALQRAHWRFIAIATELKVALPLKPTDVLAHEQRVINFTFVVDRERVENLAENPTPKDSNGWSIAAIGKNAVRR